MLVLKRHRLGANLGHQGGHVPAEQAPFWCLAREPKAADCGIELTVDRHGQEADKAVLEGQPDALQRYGPAVVVQIRHCAVKHGRLRAGGYTGLHRRTARERADTLLRLNERHISSARLSAGQNVSVAPGSMSGDPPKVVLTPERLGASLHAASTFTKG